MGRITIDLDNAIDARMRAYINATYSTTHGRLTNVVEEALTAFLDQKEAPQK